MKAVTSLLILSALFLVPACSGEEAQARMSEMKASGTKLMEGGLASLKELDVSELADLSTEKVKGVYSDATAALAEKLSSIQDIADAEKLKENVGPMLDKLGLLKDKLGDKLPTMDSLSSAVSSLKDKFAENDAIMGVLQPILDKIQALLA